MSIVWATNAQNDIYAVGGKLQIKDDLAAVGQACEQAVKMQLGEAVYATNRGVDTFGSLWDGSPNVVQFEASARRALISVPGVTSVFSFNVAVAGDVASYTATIKTIFGVTSINGQL